MDEIRGAEAKLKDAMPVIKKCEEAVGSISKSDFAELKNLSNPPTVVKTIVDMLLLMFGI